MLWSFISEHWFEYFLAGVIWIVWLIGATQREPKTHKFIQAVELVVNRILMLVFLPHILLLAAGVMTWLVWADYRKRRKIVAYREVFVEHKDSYRKHVPKARVAVTQAEWEDQEEKRIALRRLNHS